MILSLARVEGRRLLRHPVFLAGIGLSVVMVLSVVVVLIGGNDSVRSTHSVVEPLWPAGFPIGPLAVFGFVATNLAAMRDRLSGTEELFGSTALPTEPERRLSSCPLPGPPPPAWCCLRRSWASSRSRTG
ncbi:MAG: hypothetical protein M3Q23_11860 [Actinomycetota bacterium]|nr:hypothetical protein [Actinomycetota bacterium]